MARTVGTILSVAAVVTGNPWIQLAAIAVNAYANSREVIQGPQIGDVPSQTANEGGFRPFLYGRSVPIAGNIIADHEPYIVKKRTRQGKGGPKVESESAYRTYAVGFCEGEASLLQVWRNGILVYDVEDPDMAPENVEFLKYARWHTGSFQQMPDPSIEGTHGVGNAPAFRGTAYLVLTREDVTDQRGAWSQWQVRVFRGTQKSYTTAPYPVYWNDGIGVSLKPYFGAIPEWPVESITISSMPIGGSVRDILQEYRNYLPEEIGASARPDGGALNDVMRVYGNYAPESLNSGSPSPLGGEIKLQRLTYSNYLPESIDAATVQPIGGMIS